MNFNSYMSQVLFWILVVPMVIAAFGVILGAFTYRVVKKILGDKV